jgi:hypothetical protein
MLKQHRPPTTAQLQKIVDRFNARFAVGSKFILRTDTRGDVETTVRAPAEVLQGHSAIGWFEGVRGAYSIEGDRVRPKSQ